MTYPQTIQAVTDKLNAVAYAASSSLSTETQQALIAAAAHPSVVERCHKAIAALHPVFDADGASMDQSARELLAGSIRLCNENAWAARGGIDYPGTLAAVIATLPAADPVEEDTPAE
ncbi:hypothetical protein D1227_06515 [Henriciella mobilis]|uniref:hypothetical protein n=1 Tax=Henriciella mobilis TaxID=2305467 RepID=UPI000E6618AE|nr:hypothetical protein [Henriciella mobilis]RIJ15937.1 hypothetical protein D1231_09085 [Henriciella mobilis]RIJ21147.1 hypothetical protein D1227_12625 [Henriciella mobilis]RIJ23153.1 hypothetical protein D1227_06515 [Henriciella mobilis]